MALGAVEVSPLEMAGAYAAFANGGRRAETHGITRIRTPQGRVIYQRQVEDRRADQVIQNPSLYYLNQMLRGVITSGTARSVAISGRDLAGKTGTTSDYKDAWFAGYTGGFVTVVWVGKDDNSAMRGVTGGSSPAAIWRGFMQAALPRLNVRDIPNGPPLPEGWVPPTPPGADPVGDLLGGLGDLFGEEDLPPVGDDPLAGLPANPRPAQPAPERPSVRPPEPIQTEPPAQNPEPDRQTEQRPDPLFF